MEDKIIWCPVNRKTIFYTTWRQSKNIGTVNIGKITKGISLA